MIPFRVDITCERHGDRPRVIDSFIFTTNLDTGKEQWFWEKSKKTGGGPRFRDGSALRDWHERKPSHETVREGFPDDVPRVRLRCQGHADVGMLWPDFIERYLEPCRAHDQHTVPVRIVVSSRTAPTRRRN